MDTASRQPNVSDVRRARPAGALFRIETAALSALEDCAKAYGYAIAFSEGCPSETEYLERPVARLYPDWVQGNRGTHSYTRTDKFEVIDGNFAVKVSTSPLPERERIAPMQNLPGETIVIVAYSPNPVRRLICSNLPANTFLCFAPRASQPTILSQYAGHGRHGRGGLRVGSGGVERAHTNPAVLKLWERYAAACDIVPLVSLPEASKMFASFTPIDL